MMRSVALLLLLVIVLTGCGSVLPDNVGFSSDTVATDSITNNTVTAEPVDTTDAPLTDTPSTDAPVIDSFVGSDVKSEDIVGLLKTVSNFYLNDYVTNRGDYPDYNDWKSSTFQLGMLEAFKVTGDSEYYRFVVEIAEKYGYQVNFGADTDYLDLATTMLVYSDLDAILRDDAKLTDALRNADYAVRKGTLNYSWIDEIYMVSSSYQYLTARTGDPKYGKLDYDCYMRWRAKLFDTEEGLWYRDSKFIYNPNTKYVSSSSTPNVSPNGKKVFWGRGNAWVYVSLARNLRIMDKNAIGYEQYLADFKAMSEALLRTMHEDGYWRANLGDPDHYKTIEMTGTGGFWFGICVGIELGILDAEVYLPVAEKIYQCVTENVLGKTGRVGYCQPVGSAPAAASKNDTNMFGVGLTMMGAAAFMRLCEDYVSPIIDQNTVRLMDEECRKASDHSYYLEPGYLKSSEITKAYSAAKKDYSSNTPNNLFDGDYMYQSTGSSWVGGGLKSGNVTLDITLANAIDIRRVSFMPRSCRAYKFRIDVSEDGKEYITVTDTTKQSYPGGRHYNWDFDTVENVKYVRLVFTGIWGDPVDWVTITELFLYGETNN